MSDSPVSSERRGNVLVVTIDRPEARNSINAATAEGIGRAMDELDADADLRCGVVTGAGGFFSAGMDLKAFTRGETPYYGDRGFAGITGKPSVKPLVAAIEGFALAGGFEIALACDIVVASREAKLGIPEVKRSLVASAGGLLHLGRTVAPPAAMEMALTGDPIDAERAYGLGLVSRVVDPGTALEAALELAERVAANGPLALVATKKILRQAREWSDEEQWVRQGEIAGEVLTSEDAREGAIAFAEKRDPVWKGR